MSIYNILTKIKNTKGSNDKLAILQDNISNELLKNCLKLMLDDTLFYIKKIPMYDKLPTHISLEQSLKDIKYYLTERNLTGNSAIEFLSTQLSGLSEDDAEVLKMIIKKDANCGLQEKSVNKIWKGLIRETPYKRCSNELSKAKFPALAQTKADGFFVNIICSDYSVVLLSRNGKVVDLHGMFENKFASINNIGKVLHGELLVLDNTGNILDRKTGNGIINKAIKGTITDEECSRIICKLWDSVDYECWNNNITIPIAEKDRFLEVSNIVSALNNQTILITDCEIINTIEEANDFYQRQIEKGEEGAVIKWENAPWENKTSKYCIKMKAENECELYCYDTLPHNKYPEQIGAICCKDASGTLLVNVGSGLDELDRKLSPDAFMGKIVSIKYNEVITSKSKTEKSLFLPRFIEIRSDKNIADTFK